jgi:hypothetical protein
MLQILGGRAKDMLIWMCGIERVGPYRVVQGLPEGSLDYGDYSAWLLGGSAVIGTLGSMLAICNS